MNGREQSLVEEVLKENYLNEGDVTTRFEMEVSQRVGAKYGIAATSGTAALFLALAAAGIGPGDEVLVPDITFIASANAVRLAGATPILVDVDAATLTISPDAILASITPRTKAVMPVHLSGRSADMESILAIARARGLIVIEDAAEALLSARNGRFLGTLGNAGCLSFSPNKTITTGQGGMILTNDESMHNRLRELKDHGRHGRGTGGDDIHHALGFNFKLTNLQAAIGLGQIESLDERVRRQKSIYQHYAKDLTNLPGLVLPGFHIEEGEIPQWTDALVEKRDALDQFLIARGIHCRRFWFPLHTQAPYRLADDRFPISSRLNPHALWLPSAFTLSDNDVQSVCDAIRQFLSA
jgi:perosamine synthetase